MITLTKTTNKDKLILACIELQQLAHAMGRIHCFGRKAPKYLCAGVADWTWSRERGGVYTPDTSLPIPQILREECKLHGGYDPDVVILNHYTEQQNNLGWHQDKDEKSREKIVSISLQGNARFHYKWQGTTKTLDLSCGDVLVFGEEHRMISHAVESLSPLRLNLTFRKL